MRKIFMFLIICVCCLFISCAKENNTANKPEVDTTTKVNSFELGNTEYQLKNITYNLPNGFTNTSEQEDEGYSEKVFLRSYDDTTDYFSVISFEYDSSFTLEDYCNDYIEYAYNNWNTIKNLTEISNNNTFLVYEFSIKQTPAKGSVSEKYGLNHAFLAGCVANNEFYVLNYIFKDKNLEYDNFLKILNTIKVNENIDIDVDVETTTTEIYTTLSDTCKLTLPKLNQEFGSNVWGETAVIKITDISYEFDDSYDGKTCNLTITFAGEKIYDSEGKKHNSDCWFDYKVYDKDNVVVDSGTVITDEIYTGEKIKGEEVRIYNLEPGKYKLKLFEYNN